MKTRHIFVPVLDVGEMFPFTVKKTETVAESMQEQEKAHEKLVEFIDKLEKKFGEGIYYLGFDEIGGKFYERFMFEKSGFLEIMVEAPAVINAHFVAEAKADKFCAALKDTLREILPKNKAAEMFINSITVQTEQDDSLTYRKWETMKDIRDK
jgi:hypothetical protein